MKILVALDGSSNSDAVFDIALRQIQNKKTDSLFLLCATEAVSDPIPLGSTPLNVFPFSMFSKTETNEPTSEAQKYDPKGQHVGVLTKYASQCESRGITHHAILGVGEHVGTLVCQAVTEKGIDLVVLGRRKFGSFERLFAGSTSKYCIENAPCNVLVVKDDMPAELHGDVHEVIQATERERARRIRQEEVVEVHSDLNKVREMEEAERKRRIQEASGPLPPDQALKKEKFERDLGRNIARLAEEEERMRRIREEESFDRREKIERDAAHHATIRAEEKERERRIQQEKDLDDAEELNRKINQKTADLWEEKERERRLEEETPHFIDRSLQIELLGHRQA